jgi:predicted transcriptional regulator
MYKAFLSYSQMKEYLTILTDNDLLSYDEVTRVFKTTEKGLRFLQTYNRIGDVMKIQQVRVRREV